MAGAAACPYIRRAMPTAPAPLRIGWTERVAEAIALGMNVVYVLGAGAKESCAARERN